MSTAMSKAESNALVVSYDVLGTHVELDLDFVKKYLVRGKAELVSNQELVFFMNTCRQQKLNPLVQGEVYLIKYSKDDPAQMVVGKDAYLRRAFDHPDYLFKNDGITVQRGNEIMAVLIDGKLAGVFGLDKSALTMGAFGTQVSDAVFLMYGMTVPHKTYRLGRLLTMLAQNRPLIMNICTDLEKEKAKSLKTVQMTKYPEAKEMRGLMELTKKVPDKKMGYRLTYESPLYDRNAKQALNEWLGREERWQKQREKTKSAAQP